jgi:subtilisin family serine protease
MKSTWVRLFLVVLVVLCLSSLREDTAARATTQPIDLATYPASRWIVQLSDPPLAQYRGGLAGLSATAPGLIGHRLDFASVSSTAYLTHLRTERERVTTAIAKIARGARVERSYEVTVNGIAVAMSPKQAAAVRALPGVKAVTPDIPFQLSMFSTPRQIGAPKVWDQLGGQARAGEGIKVAIIDSGIYVTRNPDGSYAGNPCFDDTGYTAPPGFPKGDQRFTNNKVIVARAYFRPGDPPADGNETPLQGPGGSPHGTHAAGTAACNPGITVTYEGTTVTLAGIAPRAYLMNYRVFYPTKGGDEFGNGNAYVAELVDAIDDAVRDGAHVISNSWGASYQNTLAWADPMVQAVESAIDAGVVVVVANGNSGPQTATAVAPAISSKAISVGAVTKDTTIASGVIDVTAPTPVSTKLQAIDTGPALFGPTITNTFGPAPYVPVEKVTTDASPLGCPLDGDVSPYPQGVLVGKVALIERGTCEFSVKAFHAQRAGAVAAVFYNSRAGGENLQSISAGAHAVQVTIPSWFIRRSKGLALRDFAAAHPGKASVRFTFDPHPAPNIGDVLAEFSSRGPTQDKRLKPDLLAPGVDILSAGYGRGDFPAPFTGFGVSSGTSMATPHVAGAAAVLRHLHPDWTPAQVKSALMSTANERVFLDPARAQRAGVLDRGAGRIDLAKAASPGLTFDRPSLSAGELPAGKAVTFTIHVRSVDTAASIWKISTDADPGLRLSVASPSITVPQRGKTIVKVRVASVASAAPNDYGGSVGFTNVATGKRLHVPVWLRVVPTKIVKDVLLVDGDGSSTDPRFRDYAKSYQDALSAARVSYAFIDVGTTPFPSLNELYRYRAVILFTGDNDSVITHGLAKADQDRLAEWLDSGGRLWAVGQNLAEVTDVNPTASARLGRSRIYHGYLGIAYETGAVYPGPAPSPTAQGHGPMNGLTLDLAPGKDGAGNQLSIEASSPMPDTDTFAATDTTIRLFRQIGGNAPVNTTAIAFGRSGEPDLEDERVPFHYRSVAMGFGLEGINTTASASRADLVQRTLNWLLDEITVTARPTAVDSDGRATFVVKASSSVGAKLTSFRWDFGDGSPLVTTDQPVTKHRYQQQGHYRVRVEVTDDLGHRVVDSRTVTIRRLAVRSTNGAVPIARSYAAQPGGWSSSVVTARGYRLR